MNKWGFLTITVSHKGNGNIDFVLKRDDQSHAKNTYDEIDAYFNVTMEEWLAHLNGLKENGWEPVSVRFEEKDDIHIFKKMIADLAGT